MLEHGDSPYKFKIIYLMGDGFFCVNFSYTRKNRNKPLIPPKLLTQHAAVSAVHWLGLLFSCQTEASYRSHWMFTEQVYAIPSSAKVPECMWLRFYFAFSSFVLISHFKRLLSSIRVLIYLLLNSIPSSVLVEFSPNHCVAKLISFYFLISNAPNVLWVVVD